MIPLEDFQIFLIFALTFLATFIWLNRFSKKKSLPGPFGLPILGYFPFLGTDPHKKFDDLSKKYGNIFSLNILSSNCVIVTDYNLAKEILSHPSTNSRPKTFLQILPGKGGFAGSSGSIWLEQRKFCISKMVKLGLGKGPWETMIQEDVDEFVQEIRSWQGKANEFLDPLKMSLASNNMALLIGRRLVKEKSNHEIQVLLNTVDVIMQYIGLTAVSSSVPEIVIKFLAAFRIGEYKKVMDIMQDFGNLLRNEVQTHLNIPNSSKEDFIGYYLQELEELKNNDKENNFSVDSLVGDMAVLFIAGSDTTLSSIHWLLLIIASYPEVQKKVQDEIDNVIGKGKISWVDRARLPFTMAAIMEMERWTSINPLFPPREVTKTFEFHGYTIPRGSMLICNSWSMLHDPKFFADPKAYIPERFLTKDGKEIAKLESYIPFSIGKRDCPGKIVAMMSIFLYFATLMQKFNVRLADGKPAEFEGTFGAVLHPKKQRLCFVER